MPNSFYDKKMDSISEMENTQQVGVNSVEGQKDKVRTADLPSALQGGNGGYSPGSTNQSGFDLPPNLEMPSQNPGGPSDTQNQMLPPTSSPVNGGQFQLK